MVCPRCRTENREGRRFCSKCGVALAAVCPSCGFTNEPGDEFCGGCGARLGTPQPLEAKFTSPDAYTPKHLAEKILTSKAALEGERKQVTVLFADLKGSMELLADRDPEEARKLLDPVLQLMIDAVHRYEGTVNQVMGDGIMALFGAPVAHEDHAVRACYAALRMQESAKKYAEEVRRSHAAVVKIRVGLNSGEVVVRAIGSDLHMDYTAVGQTTHLAARMEQIADPGAIVITPDTLALAEGYVEAKSLGPVPVKGLADAVEVYEVTGAGPARTRLQAAAGRGLTRFVGRDAELEHLRRAQELAGAGRGQMAAIVGEAGVGKSRLVFELTHSHRVNGWLVLETGSVSYGTATSYLPVVDLLKGYFKIVDRDTHRDIQEKVTGKLLTLERALEPTLPALLALLDVPVDDPQWGALDPPHRRQRTLDAIKRLLLREAQVRPLLLVFEDLHWIDSETQILLDSLVESLPSTRLLLLVNYRPEYSHAWGSKTFYTQLRLDAFQTDGATELLDALLGSDASLDRLKAALSKATGGNPFFIEESVRILLETKALLGERGTYRLSQPADRVIQVPATVQAILAARIDRLAPEDKRLLETAAVIGKDFPFALLQAIADADDASLRRGLSQLQAAEFIYETSLFPDLEFTFKHALTHEVAYGNLLHERRRTLHGRIVEAMEHLYVERASEHVERLAEHARRGEVWDKAALYLPQAAAKAAARGSSQGAAACIEDALAALVHLPNDRVRSEEAIDLRIELRNNLLVRRQNAAALECISQAETAARKLDDRQRLARVLAHKTHSLWLEGRYSEAIGSGREALALGQEMDDFSIVVAATQYLGQVYLTMGVYAEAIALLRWNVDALHGALASERFAMHALPSVLARGFLADCLSATGEFAEAVDLASDGVRIAESIGHPFSIVASLALCGLTHVRKGEVDASIPILERGLQLGRAWDIRQWISSLVARLALAYAASGRLADATQILASAKSLGAERNVGLSFGADLSQALLLSNRAADATELANRVLSLTTGSERAHHAWTLRVLGEIASSEGAPEAERAAAYYHQALEQGSVLGLRPHVAHCYLGLGKLSRRTGKRQEAREHLATAATMYHEMDMRFWLEQAEAESMELSA